MIVGEKFVGKLKEFGLNSYEAKIWIALLSRGVSSAGELSDISNVPRSRAYDVLESLEKKGFIVMKIGKPIKYIAVKPQEVLERVKKRIQEDAVKQADLLDEIKKDPLLKELELLYSKGVEVVDPSELSGSLRDRTNLYNNINMLINNAQDNITIMTTEEGLVRKSESLKKALEKASKRGISIRIAAPITNKSEKAAELLQQFAEVRHVDVVKSRFCIVDNKEITFGLLDDAKSVASYDVGLWVTSEFFAKALEGMFNQVWNTKAAKLLKH
ncbi:TrmB family transcriptional regulator [Candidatus Woesearchaeota archaeon]|nr:TrmB family transcriptional regulator [Candidatus Woesearchaeota archaeon]